MVTMAQQAAPGGTVRHPFATAPVLGVAAVTAVLLLVASRNYGYFFDEAYFVVAGHDHLAWGYFDQPPLVPALAGLAQHLFPGSLVALRVPGTLAAAGGVVLTALIARDLGGRRSAQVLAATAYALSGAVRVAHWLATYSLDPFFWALILWLVVRWTTQRRTGTPDDRLLLVAGLVTALSLQTKFLVPALWVAIAVTALACGPRDLVRRPMLWVGAVIATAVTVPTLLWQMSHDWPYMKMQRVVSHEYPGLRGYLWDGLSGAGVLIGVPLLLVGIAVLLVHREFAAYRFLGLTVVGLVVAFALLSGRAYYLLSLYSVPLAAGAVALQRVAWSRALKVVGALALVVSAAGALLTLPVYPEPVARKLPDVPLLHSAQTFVESEEMLPRLAGSIDQVFQALPPQLREHTAVVTDSYVFAAGVDLFGRTPAIPRAYSGHRGYYYFGAPPEEDSDVLFFGDQNPALRDAFTTVKEIAPGFATLYIGRKESWQQLWPKLQSY